MKRPIIITTIVIATMVIGIIILNLGNRSVDNASTHNKMDKSVSSSSDQPKENEVFMKGFAFGPKKLTIKVGTTVTWTNKDDAHHDITPDGQSSDFVASKLLAKGESYSFTFKKAGIYNYHCSPHPYMKSVIEVTP